MSDPLFHPEGVLDAAAARRIVAALDAEHSPALDFDAVEDIHFGALRVLMNARRSGLRFSIINACDAVSDRFTDTGVSAWIDVCRKPRPLDLSRYEEFGASFLSKAYNSKDGDSMIKVYGTNVSKLAVAREKAVARAVMLFGLPTPLVGTLYETEGRTALDYERIEGKRSFSRVIAEEPERLGEMTRRFARMCRQLHQTPCDTALFRDSRAVHRQAVLDCPGLDEAARAAFLRFVDSIPAANTCLHGDMQMSNVITTGEEDLWIDLGDFGYGEPKLDIAMWYFLSRLNTEENVRQLFHLGLADLARIWDIFVEEYADARSSEEKQAFEQAVIPYAALHMIYIGVEYGFQPGLLDAARSLILNQF